VRGGSYNRRWNAQVLRGLQELGQIDRRQLSIDQAAGLELPIGDMEEPHNWERVGLVAIDLHEEDFFASVWEPWRLRLMGGSQAALEGVKSLLRPHADVCHILAEAYAPGPAIQERFGLVAEYIQPMRDCGRCPGCRHRNVEPPTDPPPRVPCRWIVDHAAAKGLEALIAAAPTAERLAIVITADPVAEAPAMAVELIRAGVRFFAGVQPKPPVGVAPWWFLDESDVSPGDVPPVPGLVVPAPGEPVSQAWLVASARPPDVDGRPVPIVLLVGNGTLVGARRVPVERLGALQLETAMSTLRLVAG
jgi:ATP-dependent DNA helicase RecQ